MALENNIINFNDYFIGEVMGIDISTRKVAAYIPKLMTGLAAGSSYSTSISTTSNLNITGIDYTDTIKIRNSIWVRASNKEEPMPATGSKVIIYFIDGSPKNGFWKPFNFNGEYEVIDAEKYANLFNLEVAGKNIQVTRDDLITIKFPDTFSSVLNTNEKNKKIFLTQKEYYVFSDTKPSKPFEGQLWYNTINKKLSMYKDESFQSILFDSDIEDIYTILEATTNRILFVTATRNIEIPVANQIVGIDSLRQGSGFYTYTTIADTGTWATTERKNGIYYLSYINKMKEIVTGIEGTLKSYLYNGTKWTELDGWITWTQPVSLDDFDNAITLTALTPEVVTFTNTDNVKVSKITFDGINFTVDGSATFAFTTTSGAKVGESFTLTRSAGVYTLTPSYYANAYYNDGILTLPDIVSSGVIINDLICTITADTSLLLNFGTVTITGKIEGVE